MHLSTEQTKDISEKAKASFPEEASRECSTSANVYIQNTRGEIA